MTLALDSTHVAAPIAFAPFKIGDICIETPLTLAPMAGQTSYALRALCRQAGACGLVCTELLSSQAIHYKSRKTFDMLDWSPDEFPFAVQLYGSDPELMAEAARFVVDRGASIVDINMGCWVPKVAKTGAGAALLRDLCTATRVVEAVVRAVKVPVTVKVRAGWDANTLTAVPFAQAAEQAGVQAIAVHARTAAQGFSGTADWSIIRQVKAAVRIPVIGNGDVTDAETALRMFQETGCDAVMIGRGALGKPWLFKHIAHAIRTGERLPPPSPSEIARLAIAHARLALSRTALSEKQACLELRGQLTKYQLGVPRAAALRDQLVRAESLAEIEACFSAFL
jgi:tRNA-dihydrouridine synthase B